MSKKSNIQFGLLKGAGQIVVLIIIQAFTHICKRNIFHAVSPALLIWGQSAFSVLDLFEQNIWIFGHL